MRNSIQFSTAGKVAKDSKTLNEMAIICQAYVREMDVRPPINISFSSDAPMDFATDMALHSFGGRWALLLAARRLPAVPDCLSYRVRSPATGSSLCHCPHLQSPASLPVVQWTERVPPKR